MNDTNQKQLGKTLRKIAEGLAELSTDSDTLGDAYEYLIGQFAAGSGRKAGELYTPQRISDILSAIVTLDGQAPDTGPRKKLASVLAFACGSGSLLPNVRNRLVKAGGSVGMIHGQEKNITTYNLCRMNMLLHGVKDSELEIYHGDTPTNDWDMLREQNPRRSRRSTRSSSIRRSATAGIRRRPSAKTCGSRATGWRPRARPTSPF